MDEIDDDSQQPRGPHGGRVVATVIALMALVGGSTVALVSVGDDADPPTSPLPSARPSPPPSGPPTPEPTREPLAIPARAPTVYDSARHVGECASARADFPGPSGSAGFDDDIARISESVERIRKLELARPIDTRLVSADEVGERFARGLERSYSPREAAADERVLAVLRLVPEGLDLRGLSLDLARGTAAGFYNPRTKRLFARTSGSALTPYDEVVLAHEIDHALVDQTLRLPATLSADPMLADVMLAHQALAEGDATLLMSKYGAGTLDPAALDAFLARFSSPAIAGYPGVPYVLQRMSGFPYYEGFLFACAAWREGGWKAIDKMYRRPPKSTAEIVFPWRHEERAAGELPPSPSAPGPRWEELVVASFGVFDLMLMLENADVLRTGEAAAGSHVDDVRGWNGSVQRQRVSGPGVATGIRGA